MGHPGATAVVEDAHTLAHREAFLRVRFLDDRKAAAFIETNRNLQPLATGNRFACMGACHPTQCRASNGRRIPSSTRTYLISKESTPSPKSMYL